MTERPTWIICRHVMDGSASTVTISANGLCACDNCSEQVNLMETDQVHIVEEDRLKGILEDIKTVNGVENLKGNNWNLRQGQLNVDFGLSQILWLLGSGEDVRGLNKKWPKA